jgi:hypothetical protein
MASTRFTTNYEPYTGDIDVFVNFVKRLDKGRYKCRAENKYGHDETFTSILIIDVPNVDETPQTQNPDVFKSFELPYPLNASPQNNDDDNVDAKLNLSPPVVIIPLQDAKILEEQPLVLTCKIIGNPKPKVVGSFYHLKLTCMRLAA